jgi:hypothetical protein
MTWQQWFSMWARRIFRFIVVLVLFGVAAALFVRFGWPIIQEKLDQRTAPFQAIGLEGEMRINLYAGQDVIFTLDDFGAGKPVVLNPQNASILASGMTIREKTEFNGDGDIDIEYGGSIVLTIAIDGNIRVRAVEAGAYGIVISKKSPFRVDISSLSTELWANNGSMNVGEEYIFKLAPLDPSGNGMVTVERGP